MTAIIRHISRFAQNHAIVVDLSGLMLGAIAIHALYVLFIDPAATETVLIAQESGGVPERTLAIILKDLEQELCIILTFWCIWLWAFRYRLFEDESYLLELDFLNLNDLDMEPAVYGEKLLDDIEARLQSTASKFADMRLLTCVQTAITSLRQNGDFKEASDTATQACDLHLEVLNSKLSITKYILWAIPSVGFLGTVRGIGEALGKAGEAMAGDISGVATSLGVAFNSTFVALFLSLILMFISYVLQGREERLVVSYKHFISSTLIAKLSMMARQKQSDEP